MNWQPLTQLTVGGPLASLFVNVIYCAVQLTRNATWTRLREKGNASYWLLAAVMGTIWMFSIMLYGRGAAMMGPLGSSVGSAVFYCSMIIVSAFWGIASGEWREGSYWMASYGHVASKIKAWAALCGPDLKLLCPPHQPMNSRSMRSVEMKPMKFVS